MSAEISPLQPMTSVAVPPPPPPPPLEPFVVGSYVGQCKWFSDKLGYGFVTIHMGEDKGKDVFAHHSGIVPMNSTYRTLRKGEYINFNIVDGGHGLQAVDITGIDGGCLMCDFAPVHKPTYAQTPECGQV